MEVGGEVAFKAIPPPWEAIQDDVGQDGMTIKSGVILDEDDVALRGSVDHWHVD